MRLKNKLASRLALLGLGLTLGINSVQAADNNPQNWPPAMHDNTVLTKFMLDRLERRDGKDADQTYWEAQAWVGSDINKLWLKTEGHRVQDHTDDAEVELYYSRAVTAFWDAQVGVRHDMSTSDKPARDWLGFGFLGLAPYRFEIDATAYVGEKSRTALRFTAEYDLLLTQRLVFSPELELNAYGKKDEERGIGSGLSDGSLTLRLRYDIRREFSPYIGVMWSQKYGDTADLARADGETASDAFIIGGIKAWW